MGQTTSSAAHGSYIQEVLLVQAEGHPTVRVFEKPKHGAAVVSEIPSHSEAIRFIDDVLDAKKFYRIQWRDIQGWVGVKNVRGLSAPKFIKAFDRLDEQGSVEAAGFTWSTADILETEVPSRKEAKEFAGAEAAAKARQHAEEERKAIEAEETKRKEEEEMVYTDVEAPESPVALLMPGLSGFLVVDLTEDDIRRDVSLPSMKVVSDSRPRAKAKAKSKAKVTAQPQSEEMVYTPAEAPTEPVAMKMPDMAYRSNMWVVDRMEGDTHAEASTKPVALRKSDTACRSNMWVVDRTVGDTHTEASTKPVALRKSDMACRSNMWVVGRMERDTPDFSGVWVMDRMEGDIDGYMSKVAGLPWAVRKIAQVHGWGKGTVTSLEHKGDVMNSIIKVEGQEIQHTLYVGKKDQKMPRVGKYPPATIKTCEWDEDGVTLVQEIIGPDGNRTISTRWLEGENLSMNKILDVKTGLHYTSVSIRDQSVWI